VVKLSLFSEEASQVVEFVIACKLYIRIRMRDVEVEKQVYWILTYMQRELVDIWKENLLENIDIGKIQFKSVAGFLEKLKGKFGRGDDELNKVAKLKKVEQRERTIEEFQRAVRGSRYER